MKNITIETFDGTIANKRDCRFIKGDFYIKNKQCFLINGTWYRINSGFIVFDYEKRDWVIQKDNNNLVKGIVGFDKEKNEIIIGHYTKDQFKNVNVYLKNGSSYNCIDYRILPSDMFKEDTVGMIFSHVDTIKLPSLGGNRPVKAGETYKIPSVQFGNHGYPMTLPYCCKHYDEAISNRFLSEATPNVSFATNLAKYFSELGNVSFGFEFETNRGKIPNYKLFESGLMPLRDGSINGIEFATIPLSGRKGVLQLEKIADMLKTYTAITNNESMHLHIGNIPTNKKFVGYLYTLCCVLEDQIFSLFPKYYAETSKFKARGKDYNKPLKKELVSSDPEETFANIAFHLSDGKKYQGFGSNHPSDPEGREKWHIDSRYTYCNFISLLFGKAQTLEFRVHTPTRDIIKILSWLYICTAIVKYAEKMYNVQSNLNDLRHVTLKQVVSSIYSIQLSNYLNDYIAFRRSERKLNDVSGDFTGSGEILNEMKGLKYFDDIIM